MGQIYKACCSCGYIKELYVGGGRADYLINFKYPFYCEKCGLVTINVYKPEFKCPKCRTKKVTPYGRKPVSTDDEIDQFQEINFAVITQNTHLCPECKQMILRFDSIGFCD